MSEGSGGRVDVAVGATGLGVSVINGKAAIVGGGVLVVVGDGCVVGVFSSVAVGRRVRVALGSGGWVGCAATVGTFCVGSTAPSVGEAANVTCGTTCVTPIATGVALAVPVPPSKPGKPPRIYSRPSPKM